MKKKIQKVVSVVFLMVGFFSAPSLFAAEFEPLPLFINGVAVPSKVLNKKLPNFLPKEDYWIDTLKGRVAF